MTYVLFELRDMMRYWWVNQNQTYKHEVAGGFLWSPKTRADGARNQFYDYMQNVEVGDAIFSFYNTRIRAIGIATGQVKTAPKPDFGDTGANWSKDGWLIPVEFTELINRIRPKDHIKLLLPYLPEKYSPLQKNGNGLQAAYLTSVPLSIADILIQLIGTEFNNIIGLHQEEIDELESIEETLEQTIKGRTDIGATTKEQLVKSRRGQGIFKQNVFLNEKKCRVTGVSDLKFLRASHIKPWKDSNDDEKLNGCNGLLLAPHIDHLFDKGMISFKDNGDLIISKKLNRKILIQWDIKEILNVGLFNPTQIEFLFYHRKNIFKI